MAALSFQIDVTKFAQARIDATGVGGVTYYGFTHHAKAVDADAKWTGIKETVTGTVTTIQVAGFKPDGEETQVWANRATLSYTG